VYEKEGPEARRSGPLRKQERYPAVPFSKGRDSSGKFFQPLAVGFRVWQ